MKVILYDGETGLLCKRYPTNIQPNEKSKSIFVSDEEYNETMSCPAEKLWAVVNDSLTLVDNTTYLNSPEYKKRQAQDELSKLYSWFDKYDMQVKQYGRDIRTKQTPFIHIDNIVYGSLEELDNQATIYQVKIKELRTILGE